MAEQHRPRRLLRSIGALLAGFLVVVALSLGADVALRATGVGPSDAARGDAKATVALTFDDLPAHAALPPGVSRTDVARSILAALRSHHAPATYGFVNAKSLDGAPDNAEVLRLWRAAGHPLANHAFSHMDLNANSAEAFEEDVIANEATLRKYMGHDDWHWLRFPYLRAGETTEKRQAVAAFLKARGYRVAEVTLNFDDWAYNDPYARCVARNDTASIAWLKESYLRRATQSLSAGQEASKLLYGRDIAHVMLLHVGAFQTVMLPRLLELLEQNGFRLVTLPEAESDPAYASVPGVAFDSGATLFDQMAAAKRVSLPPLAEDPMARLAGLCASPASRAADEKAVADVADLDTQYQAAVEKNDAEGMARILLDDFVLVVGNGTVYTKPDLIKSAQAREIVWEHQVEEPGTQKVRVWGDTAVVTAKLWLKGTSEGKPIDKKLWFSDTYVRTPKGWRYAFGQSSLSLPPSP